MFEYGVSVIIPVYNVEKYLKECMNSVLNQTKKNIEIICIDDGSTDDSLSILESVANRDYRVCLIKNGENKGRLYTRKRGVMMARGEYIMFLDGDDFYTNNACEVAYTEIVKHKVEILQFGMNVINEGNAPQFEVDSFVKFVQPYTGRLEHKAVLESCFKFEKYNYNLVNKIYNADLCKMAFSELDDQYYCMAEDMLAYFALAYFSDSYKGITEKLYNYNFAIGISKPGRLDLKGLEHRCCGANSIESIKRFLIKKQTFEEHIDIYKKIERRMLSDNFDAWYYRLPIEDRAKGYEIFEKHWSKDQIILGLLYDIENKQFDINKKGMKIDELYCKMQELISISNQKDNELEELIYKSSCLENDLNRLEEQNLIYQSKYEEMEMYYDSILHSVSYRLGLFLTWAPRKLVKMVRDCISRKGMLKYERDSEKGVEMLMKIWDNESRAEQSRAEQSRAEQSRAEQSR